MPVGDSVPELLDGWLKRAVERGALAVISHRNGDMDTIGSACALARALGSTARACGVHVSRLAARVIESHGFDHLRLDSSRPVWPRSLGSIVIVDSASANQTGIQLPNVPMCIIDHHAASAETWKVGEGDLLIQSDAASTAQIIARWMHECHPSALDRAVRSILLAGIVTDTGRFRHGDADALIMTAKLIEDDRHLREVLKLIDEEQPDRSTRIGMLRSLARINTEDAGDWLVALTDARSHEGSIASSLIGTGADIALVSNHVDGGLRITCRASRSALAAGIDMGSIMVRLANRLGGEGGGHAGAAGATTHADRVETISAALSLISSVRRQSDG